VEFAQEGNELLAGPGGILARHVYLGPIARGKHDRLVADGRDARASTA
jgi:hypothetical protein